jgi:hypothetical protein
MSKIKQYERELINKAAGHYLSDQEEGDLYDAYQKLQFASEEGQGDYPATYFVEVWDGLDNLTVDEVLETINDSKLMLEKEEKNNPLANIDFAELHDQKMALLNLMGTQMLNETLMEKFDGIVELINSVQDYAVDVLGHDEQYVFQQDQDGKRVPVGYQIIDIDDGEPHPDMDNSFTIYCQSDAKKIIENGDEDEKGRWSIIPIYYGDIENPEYTFVGDPRA